MTDQRKCRGCGKIDINVQHIDMDPYDFVSLSPILTSVDYCLNCYNERILAAFKWIQRQKNA